MRLLSKNEVTQNRAVERKSQLDEGLKLARKVDILRQTLLTEEAKLETFRKVTTAEVQKQINNLISKKDVLAEQVKLLEEGKKKQFVVKFGIELDKIKAKEKLVESEHKIFLEKEKLLNQKELQLQVKQENLEVERRRIAEKDQRSQENIEVTEKLKQKVADTLTNTENERMAILEELAEKTKNLKLREEIVASQERDNQIKIEYIAEKELELIDRERALNDKYETLERTIKRLKK